MHTQNCTARVLSGDRYVNDGLLLIISEEQAVLRFFMRIPVSYKPVIATGIHPVLLF